MPDDDSASALTRGHSPWSYAVWLVAGLYATVLTVESVGDHDAFGSSFDLAHYDQLLWLLSRYEDPFSTIVTRPMLADHFQPAVVLLTPLYWLGLGLPGMLAAQSIALALTAPALFALARVAGASPALASIPAFAWLACPWVAAANLFEFHPAAFAPALLVLSIYAALRERYVLLLVTTLIALGLKEDVAITYAVLGILLAAHGMRRIGWALALGAALWFVMAYSILQSYGPAYDNYGRRFAGDRGDSVGDVVRWVPTHPLETLVDISGQSAPSLVLLLLSTLCLGLLAPSWILLSVPTVVHNALSAFMPQHVLVYHYHLGTMTGLFVAAAIGVHRLASIGRRGRLGMAMALSAAVAVAIGGLSVHESERELRADQARAAQHALDRIPPAAPVAATVSLLAHLSERVEVYSLPEPFAPVDWGSTLSAREFSERAARLRFVAYRDGDILPSGGFAPAQDVAGVEPLLERLGFVETARAGPVHVLERSRR